MQCEYCFYRRVEAIYPSVAGRMPDSVLERMIQDFLSHRLPISVFSWQGGEPTLAGLEFFEHVVELQKKHGAKGQVIGNSLQTNGLLIDEDWASFLGRYRFLVGISIDGPHEVHDKYRLMADGSCSWQRTMDCVPLLKKHKVEYSVLCVVSKANVGDGAKLYRWFIGNGFRNLQFIPCVEKEPVSGRIADYSVEPIEYGKFLLDVFDEWKKKDIGRVYVRTFDSLLTYLGAGKHVLCIFGDSCNEYLVIEHNGDVYPCDFYVKDGWRLGNIMDAPLASLLESEKAKRFASAKADHSAECASCEWMNMCHGGCQKDRLDADGGPAYRTYLCDGYKMLFSHAHEELNNIKDSLIKAARKGARIVKVRK